MAIVRKLESFQVSIYRLARLRQYSASLRDRVSSHAQGVSNRVGLRLRKAVEIGQFSKQ